VVSFIISYSHIIHVPGWLDAFERAPGSKENVNDTLGVSAPAPLPLPDAQHLRLIEAGLIGTIQPAIWVSISRATEDAIGHDRGCITTLSLPLDRR
jgi:hypothetical protein